MRLQIFCWEIIYLNKLGQIDLQMANCLSLTQTHLSIGDYGNSPNIMNESGNLNFNEVLCLYCGIVRTRSFSCVLILKKYCGTCRPIPNVSMANPELDDHQQGMGHSKPQTLIR
jgi:hypothetical protein